MHELGCQASIMAIFNNNINVVNGHISRKERCAICMSTLNEVSGAEHQFASCPYVHPLGHAQAFDEAVADLEEGWKEILLMRATTQVDWHVNVWSEQISGPQIYQGKQ